MNAIRQYHGKLRNPQNETASFPIPNTTATSRAPCPNRIKDACTSPPRGPKYGYRREGTRQEENGRPPVRPRRPGCESVGSRWAEKTRAREASAPRWRDTGVRTDRKKSAKYA